MIASILYATRGYTLPRIGNWLNVGTEPQYSDYAMVLNGDRETRPFAAADLYRRGRVGRILITSIPTNPRRVEPEVHEVVRSILLKCDVREFDIELVDGRCRTTFDEATVLKEFLGRNPHASVSVITNEYHTRRTRWVFRNVLDSRISRVRFVSAKSDQFNASNWWKNEDGFVWYLSEFFKFGFYQIRYGYGLVYIAATLGLISMGWCLRHRRWLKTSGI